MKWFQLFIIFVVFCSTFSYSQDIQTNIYFDYKGAKIYKDLTSVEYDNVNVRDHNGARNIGIGVKIGLILPIVDCFAFELRPGLFSSIGDYNYSGFDLGIFARLKMFNYMTIISGANLEFINLDIRESAAYGDGNNKIINFTKNFTEIYVGLRLGSEKLGVTFAYLFPLIDQIGTQLYTPEDLHYNIFIDGTLQFGFDIKLYTFKDIF